jgi:hypothetical protein
VATAAAAPPAPTAEAEAEEEEEEAAEEEEEEEEAAAAAADHGDRIAGLNFSHETAPHQPGPPSQPGSAKSRCSRFEGNRDR